MQFEEFLLVDVLCLSLLLRCGRVVLVTWHDYPCVA